VKDKTSVMNFLQPANHGLGSLGKLVYLVVGVLGVPFGNEFSTGLASKVSLCSELPLLPCKVDP